MSNNGDLKEPLHLYRLTPITLHPPPLPGVCYVSTYFDFPIIVNNRKSIVYDIAGVWVGWHRASARTKNTTNKDWWQYEWITFNRAHY